MSLSDARQAISSPPVPRPRTAEQHRQASFPWPEPWRSAPGSRPRTEYWDVTTARWHSSGPLPKPRAGD